ncbi:L-aminoadipate-semialdehyde dehydrogenase-phosphopantetheinyl transferase [Trifolium repens]|nr:L-aminoadipate-semialdehyde dehydrogenase-phosphopantetheinyl transferase [Trifolium repens]
MNTEVITEPNNRNTAESSGGRRVNGYWSLKEASVKAIGSGLIEGLNKVEFSHSNWTNISAAMDGKVMALWRFWLTELGESHCFCRRNT